VKGPGETPAFLFAAVYDPAAAGVALVELFPNGN
jgi:hypothetical protein